jgi:hypothetical protein
MKYNSIKNLYMFNVLDGLREGLSHYSGPSRAALIYAERENSPVRIYDPQNLLEGHEPKFKELYIDSELWRIAPKVDDMDLCGHVYAENNLKLAGLISFGGRTGSIFYQMWFTEHHPNMCSIGPTERWLEHASYLLAHDFAREYSFYSGTSRYVVREYATHAVRDHIRDALDMTFGWDTQFEVYPILDAVLGISNTPEEGAWPRGRLVFVQPEAIPELEFLIRFPLVERPDLKNLKHVRKMLLAADEHVRQLVSDGKSIVGVAIGEMPKCRITADFRGGYGFLRLGEDSVCSFSNGSFHSSTRKPSLVHLEEALLGADVDQVQGYALLRTASILAESAGERKHGCTLVIDLNRKPKAISGQTLECPIDLLDERAIELARSLARIDGALHIGADLCLHGFACLLDGESVPGEDRARGARFNSALRFTAKHDNIIVIVVSSDRPVSVIQGGVELTAQCYWEPFSEFITLPPTLEDWLSKR